MTDSKRTTSSRSRVAQKQPSRDRILRTVASSTAIETGESIATIESRLKSRNSRFRHLKLG